MPSTYLILSRTESTANAINTWLLLMNEKELLNSNPCRIIWDKQLDGAVASIEAYRVLTKSIEFAAGRGSLTFPLNESVVLVDAIRPEDLNISSESGGWENLIAMLISTFPEIRWHFGCFEGSPCNFASQPENLERTPPSAVNEHILFPDNSHSFLALLNPAQQDPLLDPTGLRQWVRQQTNFSLSENNDPENNQIPFILPLRRLRAAAIDEEKDYAIFHAYTAYRFGFRADIVTTWTLMKKLFSGPAISHRYWLLLEDMSLNFPDRKASDHILDLKKRRAKFFPQLDSSNCYAETSEHRILVTTGQTGNKNDHLKDNVFEQNKRYLRQKVTGTGEAILKPAGGMFDLWYKANLLGNGTGEINNDGHIRGFKAGQITTNHNNSSHGAPGKLFLIAETLKIRAEGLSREEPSVSLSIQGAVIASEALELTGGRTPTTAIQALILKHKFEVQAESQFSGIEIHLQLEERHKEIKKDVSVICSSYTEEQQTIASLNAELDIQTSLVRIFRENAQFDEELKCSSRVRKLLYLLWDEDIRKKIQENFVKKKPKYIFNFIWFIYNLASRWCFEPIIRYVNFLLNSFPNFICGIVSSILSLTVLFCFTLWDRTELVKTFFRSLEAAMTSFFSIGEPLYFGEPMATISVGYSIVTCLTMVIGFAHIGLFIAYLYSVLSRK